MIKTWFFLHITFCTLSVIFFVPEVIFTQDKAIIIFLSLVNYVYDFYSLWIVKCFISELQFTKISRGTPRSPLPISNPGDDVERGGEGDVEFTSSMEKFNSNATTDN